MSVCVVKRSKLEEHQRFDREEKRTNAFVSLAIVYSLFVSSLYSPSSLQRSTRDQWDGKWWVRIVKVFRMQRRELFLIIRSFHTDKLSWGLLSSFYLRFRRSFSFWTVGVSCARQVDRFDEQQMNYKTLSWNCSPLWSAKSSSQCIRATSNDSWSDRVGRVSFFSLEHATEQCSSARRAGWKTPTMVPRNWFHRTLFSSHCSINLHVFQRKWK